MDVIPYKSRWSTTDCLGRVTKLGEAIGSRSLGGEGREGKGREGKGREGSKVTGPSKVTW